MKIVRLFLLGLLLCSSFGELFSWSVQTIAETVEGKRELVINEPFLSVSYETETSKDKNSWRIFWEHRKEPEKQPARIKIKVLDNEGNLLEYPEVKGMEEKAGWLVEKNFSTTSNKQVFLEVPKTQNELIFSIQMDRKVNENDQEQAIEENILAVKDYRLKLTKNQTEEGENLSTENREKTIIPKSSPTLIQSSLPSVSRMSGNLYDNKEPEYTDSPTLGKYPTNAWQPNGQTNVINHQGGAENATGWDGVTNWSVNSDDRTKSYIHYGEDANNPNISIRKYIAETKTPNEFKVKLNVRGHTTYKPGLDIVFLLDNSSSMDNRVSGSNKTRKEATEEALAKIIAELKKSHQASADNIRIGGEIFSSYRGNEWGFGSSGGKHKFAVSNNPTDWDKLVAEYKRAYAMGTTFTQRGLQEAKDLFEAAPNATGRKRVLFLLTDGSPNESWKPTTYTPDNKMYFDKYYLGGFQKGAKPNYNLGNNLMGEYDVVGNTTKIVPPYAGKVTSHITTTNSTAWDLKNSGIEIHTISLSISVHLREVHTEAELLRGLYKIATKRIDSPNNDDEDDESDYFYQNVQNPDDLTETFKDWFDTIVRTVDKGKITDPMGEMVELVNTPDKQPKITPIINGAAPIEGDELATLEVTPRELKVNNLNLTDGQEIEVEYTIRLKTETPGFKFNHWYPANGQTILEPTPQKSVDKLDFGVPSVKAPPESFSIPVEKQWLDDFEGVADYFNLRASTITAVLQKKNGTDWNDVAEVDLTAGNQWKGIFTEVASGSNNLYRIKEKAGTDSKVSGYSPPTYSKESFTSETLGEEKIRIINRLLTTNYSFMKIKEDGNVPFTGTDKPQFTITRKSDGKSVVKNIQPDKEGKINVTGLPIGSYKVEETHVPDGYQKMDDFEIKVTEESDTSVVATVDGRPDEKTVVNKRIPEFSLILHKEDENGTALEGAAFQLIGTDYDKTLSSGSSFTFPNIKAGKYLLKETKTPSGFHGMVENLEIKISKKGDEYVVHIDEHENLVDYTAVVVNNKIVLTIKNDPYDSILPSTGGIGTRRLFQVASLFGLLGLGISGVYLFINRKKL